MLSLAWTPKPGFPSQALTRTYTAGRKQPLQCSPQTPSGLGGRFPETNQDVGEYAGVNGSRLVRNEQRYREPQTSLASWQTVRGEGVFQLCRPKLMLQLLPFLTMQAWD